MSDIKNVIALLCKHLDFLIDFPIKPEYFRLAKYNKNDGDAARALWATLHSLSRHAVKDMKFIDEFDRYDDIYRTKLYFAFMQYPIVEFYALSADDNTVCREILLPLGWLFATKNVLDVAVTVKLGTSLFGQEFSCMGNSSVEKVKNRHSAPMEPRSQMSRIVSKCGHAGHNIKEISELIREKIKLTTKIHAASLNTSGLPHLNVHEIALAKKSFGKSTTAYTKKDEESVKELNSMAMMLETHAQWKKKEHVFYDWMVTVVEESKKDTAKSARSNQCSNLSSFVTLLRHVTKKRLYSLYNHETKSMQPQNLRDSCISRLLRSHQEDTEAEIYIAKTTKQLNTVEIDIEKKMNNLTTELRKLLKSVKNCVEV